MTKKDEKKQKEDEIEKKEQSEKTDKDDLEKKLEEIQKEKKENEENEETIQNDDEKDKKIQELEKALQEQIEISKRAQYDYINLKWDFDRYMQNMKEKSASLEVEILISVVKKFLPFIENLRKSLTTIPDDQKESPLVKGLQMMYDNFLKVLESFNIKAIESLGLEPDSLLHEPVNVKTVEDEKMKGKIIEEFEKGFVYEKDGEKKVILPSKVVVGQ